MPPGTKVGRDRLDSLVFVSSGFLRARQTAEECRTALQNIIDFEQEVMSADLGAEAPDGTPEDGSGSSEGWTGMGLGGGYDVFPLVVIKKELRERSFGELDGTILVNYNKVRPVAAA